MAKKNKDLKFSQIKKQAKENNELEVHTFEDETILKFHPTFPPTLIEQMFEEMQEILKTKPKDLTLDDKTTYTYVSFLCIKHFTHLKNQLKATTFIGQMDEIKSLIDSGYFKKIMEEVFLPQELQKVFDELNKISSNVLFMDKMTEKMRDEVKKLELKNKSVFENLNKAKSENIV